MIAMKDKNDFVELMQDYGDSRYPDLYKWDIMWADADNKELGWTITAENMQKLIHTHAYARSKNRSAVMQRVEYILREDNHHKEASLMHDGRYNEIVYYPKIEEDSFDTKTQTKR